jgi:endonuclease/exonuclease/phosphatase (EEP) superfamily protein YafD
MRYLLLILFLSFSSARAQTLTLVELNCENLFDIHHDTLKQDHEFLPDGTRRWTRSRYWHKVNTIGQEILSCSDDIPDLVALVEVENDSVLHALTRRSLLRRAGYDYLMTCSPDIRGLDVAMLYRPSRFAPICYESIQVLTKGEQRPTRDILYIKGRVVTGDTLHLYIVHAPSRYGGERRTRPYRMQVSHTLSRHINTLGHQALVAVAGDFNDYADSPSLLHLYQYGLSNITAEAKGGNGVRGTYRYRGEWHSIDHVLASSCLSAKVDTVYIKDAPFLLEDEEHYGGKRPHRTFQAYRYQRSGFSDHLPLVVRFRLGTLDQQRKH